jgi:hypothetical protein
MALIWIETRTEAVEVGSLGSKVCTIFQECTWADNVMVYNQDAWAGLDVRTGMM